MSFLTSREQVAPQGIGKPVRRREDGRLLTGGGHFADETNLPGQGYACIVRSPHAHALIASIDTGPAEGMPGVIAVLTGSDAERDGLQPIPHRPVPANPHEVPLKSSDGSPFFLAPHPVLSVDKVRHVGEAVAVVVAETMSQATDPAERVEVPYEPLPAVTRSADAMAPEAPLVWEEHGANLCVVSEAGDQEATDTAFARAAHVVRLETAINRVTGVPMELRAAASPAPMHPSAARAAAAPPAALSGAETTAPPRYSQAHAQCAAQKRPARRQHGAGSEATQGDIADQLNQQELNRVQAGNFTSQPGA